MGSLKLRTSDKAILCPFFRAHGSTEISCEAPFERAKLHLKFCNSAEKLFQKNAFCARSYKRCELYRCIMNNVYNEE